MKLPTRGLPLHFFKINNKPTAQTLSFPFYVKECGFLNDKKMILGNRNNYDDYLLLYSITGKATFTKQGSSHILLPHQVVVSACHTPLIFQRNSNKWHFFYIIIRGSHVKKYYNLLRSPSCVFSVTPWNLLMDYFLELVSLNYQEEIYTDMKASLLIHQILFEIYQISYNTLQAKSITLIQERAVAQAKKFIEQNYQKDLDVDSICSQVNFSKYYFCKLFKEYQGLSIHQYLNEYRIYRSKDLLALSNLSINTVATSVGFKNTLTFSRLFKKETGLTPSQYRQDY